MQSFHKRLLKKHFVITLVWELMGRSVTLSTNLERLLSLQTLQSMELWELSTICYNLLLLISLQKQYIKHPFPKTKNIINSKGERSSKPIINKFIYMEISMVMKLLSKRVKETYFRLISIVTREVQLEYGKMPSKFLLANNLNCLLIQMDLYKLFALIQDLELRWRNLLVGSLRKSSKARDL